MTIERLAAEGGRIGGMGGKLPKPVSEASRKADETRALVGEKLGLSGITASRLRDAIDTVDRLEADGHEVQAAQIKDTLNHPSIRAGYNLAMATNKGVMSHSPSSIRPPRMPKPANCVPRLIRRPGRGVPFPGAKSLVESRHV